MGSLYLSSLARWLTDEGLIVIEYDGWQNRSRSSGGFDAYPLCVMWHHTASPASWDGQKDADYCAIGHEDSPISNLYIDRSGAVWILAGGASNTNGKGKSITFSRGIVPADGMNTRALGIEMGNDGIGEKWPRAQIDSAFLVSNTCNAHFGNRPDDMSTHNFYAPDRKIDPATTNVEGPWIPVSCTSSGSWDRSSVQTECLNRAGQPSPVPPPIDTEDDDMSKPEMWTLPDDAAVYVIDFDAGTKAWLPSGGAVNARTKLHELKGFDPEVKTQNDRDMFIAYGPIVGPGPGGCDAWGIPS